MMKKITIPAVIIMAMQFLAPAAFAKVCKSDSIASFPVPDYANKETTNRISCHGCTWTVHKSGYVQVHSRKEFDIMPEVLVNNQIIMNRFDTGYGETRGGIASMLLPVQKGDEIKINGGGDIGCYYIPVKFVVPNI